ncbi:MAG: hypothetical protein P0S93_06590 [Candidatus Neptunochlamydia sp.]|nr:hypothetical protein [Candidatus Neptunochlamydia sp.]
MILSNSLVNTYSTNFVERSVNTGNAPKNISDFPTETSPYLKLHTTKLDDSQPRGPLVFLSYPTSDETQTAVLKNTSGTEIVLTGGDIIYQVAKDAKEDSGLYWIQNTIKESIPDACYAFCVTSDKYIEGRTKAQMRKFKYDEVEYRIPANSHTEVSLSHRPIHKIFCSKFPLSI